MKKIIFVISFLLMGIVTYLLITKPIEIKKIEVNDFNPNLENGRHIFLASGCNSCHISEGSENKLLLAGGQKFVTNFGTFFAPNISTSEIHGIGSWDFSDFYHSIKFGQSPLGKHYFPAFPYNSYQHMNDKDIYDLWTYWRTLPSDETPSQKHDLVFPFNIRRNIGIWKTLFVSDTYFDQKSDRSTYLVEALGHCTECHTQRNYLGNLRKSEWMRGGVNPSGKGKIPSIHPADLKWTKDEIVEYLSSGFTPDFDMVGGKMASVVENISQLSDLDRELIADYLLRLK